MICVVWSWSFRTRSISMGFLDFWWYRMNLVSEHSVVSTMCIQTYSFSYRCCLWTYWFLFLNTSVLLQQIQGGRRGLLFWRRTGVQQHPTRTIRHVRANDDGVFVQNHHNWASFDSNDRSVFNLRFHLGQLQNDWNGDMLGFTLCMRPGSHGRLMPLVTDLPRSLDPVSIVIFRTGSPGNYSATFSAVCAAWDV